MEGGTKGDHSRKREARNVRTENVGTVKEMRLDPSTEACKASWYQEGSVKCGDRHNLAFHLQDPNLNTFSVFMYSFSYVTLCELEGIHIYFKSHS